MQGITLAIEIEKGLHTEAHHYYCLVPRHARGMYVAVGVSCPKSPNSANILGI